MNELWQHLLLLVLSFTVFIHKHFPPSSHRPHDGQNDLALQGVSHMEQPPANANGSTGNRCVHVPAGLVVNVGTWARGGPARRATVHGPSGKGLLHGLAGSIQLLMKLHVKILACQLWCTHVDIMEW